MKRQPTHSFAAALAVGIVLATFALSVVIMAAAGSV